ncbi:MAG: DNA repair protein RecO [Spirochaetales bacterium]|nr:DNA repair protein RecO [Spirochaetales bacterium]MBP5756307.1 DNA repair protein RecO [Spirochaetales bacterium]
MERNISTQAVVLSVRRFGELHKAVTLLSPELGLVDAIIFGGRKGKKTALAPLFSISDMQIYHNPVKNEYSVVEAVSSFVPMSITEDLACTYTAAFFCEIIAKSPSDEPDQTFGLICDALKALEQKPQNRKRITASFIWKLMQISGTACDLESCPVCDKPYAEDETLFFSNPMGVPCCKGCSDSEYLILLPGSRRYLRHTMPMSFNEAIGVEINAAAEDRIFRYMLRWASVFIQSPLKTLKELSSFS